MITSERPGKRGYLIGGAVAVVGVTLGLALIATAVVGFFQRIDDLQRISVPGTGEVRFDEAGGYSAYAESTDGTQPPLVSSLTIEPVDGGEPLALSSYRATVTYELGSRSGKGLVTFDVPRAGSYLVTAQGGGGVVAVGPGLGRGFVGRLLAGILLAAVAFFVGGAVILTTLVRRRRATSAGAWPPPSGPPGWGPPPGPGQPGWGSPPPAPPGPQGWGSPPPPPPGWEPPPPRPN